MAKLSFLAGFGAGYVLGARAGRERYEQIRRAYEHAKDDPRLQSLAGMAQARADDALSLGAHPHGQRRARAEPLRLSGWSAATTSASFCRAASRAAGSPRSRVVVEHDGPLPRRLTGDPAGHQQHRSPGSGSGCRWLATTVWSTRRLTTAGRSPASAARAAAPPAAPARRARPRPAA